MNQRFGASGSSSGLRNILISVAVFAVFAVILLHALNWQDSNAREQERELLENAVNRSISHCYAIEGVYPESIDYLVENYGLVYDEDSFFVDYMPLGADILPDVTIIAKEDSYE